MRAFAVLLVAGGAQGALLAPLGAAGAGVLPRASARAAVEAPEAPTAQDGYRSRADLKKGIASFYDGSSKLWEKVWGEHMHHGYYPEGSKRTDHQTAQSDMIDEVLKWSRADGEVAPKRVLDVGCGIGGSTRHIARAFGCEGRGVTLSPYQVRCLQALAPPLTGWHSAVGTPFHTRSLAPLRPAEPTRSLPRKALPPNSASRWPTPWICPLRTTLSTWSGRWSLVRDRRINAHLHNPPHLEIF